MATTGDEGLEKARENPPDVVLLDLGLPGLNGLSVAERIRADPQLRGVWLVAVTALSVEDEAARRGFDGYFTKPVDYDLLLLHLCRDLPMRLDGSAPRARPSTLRPQID
jgi:CheY-like chemotaxis protein